MSSDLINHISIKTPNQQGLESFWVDEHVEVLRGLACPGRAQKLCIPSHTPSRVHLSHLAVPELHPLYKPVIVSKGLSCCSS